jgi:hypothetical protein
MFFDLIFNKVFLDNMSNEQKNIAVTKSAQEIPHVGLTLEQVKLDSIELLPESEEASKPHHS